MTALIPVPGGRVLARLLLVTVVSLLVAACGPGSEDLPFGFPVDATRADGQQIVFHRPAQRVVSLSPGYTEVLFAIGAGEQVLAVDTGSDFPPEVLKRRLVNLQDPNPDAIAALEPDLVLVMSGPEPLVRALDARGLRVLWLAEPESIARLFDQIILLGQITGHTDESIQLVDSMDERVLTVLRDVGTMQGPSVYHEMSDDLLTASGSTIIGELYSILGVRNIAAARPEPYPRLTSTAVIEENPAVIILAYRNASVEAVKARPGWQEISAVEEARIFTMDAAIVNRPGPRIVEGLEMLFHLLYGGQ